MKILTNKIDNKNGSEYDPQACYQVRQCHFKSYWETSRLISVSVALWRTNLTGSFP
jgi:hypothetical protein